MKQNPFSIRLTTRQIVNLSLASYLLTVAALIVIRYTGGAWRGTGTIPTAAWGAALLVPAFDLLLGLDILRSTRRLSPARPLLISAFILGFFAAWTLWTWR